MKTGIELIAAERQRQVEKEGWTAQHDYQHFHGELAMAAVCYATPDKLRKVVKKWKAICEIVPKRWPWEHEMWKPTPDDRVRELVKAGALIAAEIDRLQNKKNE
jgi:hypothetical protein